MHARTGYSGTTFYKWIAELWPVGVSEARKRSSLEEANRRLKKM